MGTAHLVLEEWEFGGKGCKLLLLLLFCFLKEKKTFLLHTVLKGLIKKSIALDTIYLQQSA